MQTLPDALVRLIGELVRLPGIGPRSAERIALHVVNSDPAGVESLSTALTEARARVGGCQVCGALTEEQPCRLCASPARDASVVCVVEWPVDVVSLERSGTFKGRYHVLGGKLSPLNGVGPEDLRIDSLVDRTRSGDVRELILALGSDVEGEATSHYLARLLGRDGLRVTRLAQGLPVGSGLEYADELTLSRAIEGRRDVPPDSKSGPAEGT